MLKQFLNIFRNSEEPAQVVEHPHLQQMATTESRDVTYLQFLLESLRPRIEERLEKYPESDPILEVATGILIELFPEKWEEIDGPLSDDWTPRAQAPPPPPPGVSSPPRPEDSEVIDESDDGESLDESDDEEEVQSEEVDEAEAVEEESDSEESVDTDELEEDSAEISEAEDEDTEEEPDDQEDSEDAEEVHDLDELGASEEVNVEAALPAGFVSALDDTAEFAPPAVRREPKEREIWPASLDDPAVLHGARVFLAVLLDNDRLPVGGQLSPAEVLLAADLWVHLVVQATDLNERVQKLARLVEQKFGANHFSQARLLLQIFPANTETRINNDRQLFYEDMILRLGIRRSHPLGASGTETIEDGLRDVALDDDEKVRQGLEELGEGIGIKMHVYTRQPSEVDEWREFAERSDLPDVASYVLGMIPPRRWRDITALSERPVRTTLREHIVRPMARDHVIAHLKTCYFVLRAVGDTGLEPYLDSFFDWSREQCAVDATAFLPQIHRGVAGSSDLINELFSEIYDQNYRHAIQDKLEEFDDDAVDRSFRQAVERMLEADLGEIAPGNFDLGGFVLDAFLDFEYPSPDFAFRMHRLS